MRAVRPFTEPTDAEDGHRGGGRDTALCCLRGQEARVGDPVPISAVRHSARATRVLVMHEDPLLALGAFSALMSAPEVRVFMNDSDAFACFSDVIEVAVADSKQGLALSAGPRTRRDRRLRDARVLVLEASARGHMVRKAFATGAHGYALSGAGLAALREAVASVARGGRYISPTLAGGVAQSLMWEELSPREA